MVITCTILIMHSYNNAYTNRATLAKLPIAGTKSKRWTVWCYLVFRREDGRITADLTVVVGFFTHVLQRCTRRVGGAHKSRAGQPVQAQACTSTLQSPVWWRLCRSSIRPD